MLVLQGRPFMEGVCLKCHLHNMLIGQAAGESSCPGWICWTCLQQSNWYSNLPRQEADALAELVSDALVVFIKSRHGQREQGSVVVVEPEGEPVWCAAVLASMPADLVQYLTTIRGPGR